MIPPSPDAEFLAFLAEGRFMLQRARRSGAFVFYPRAAEPGTGDALDWVEASGLGRVYSATTVSARAPAQPYNVSLIDLDEGVRIMSRVEGIDPDAVRIGLRVRVRIGREGDAPIVLFEPAEEGA